MNRWYEPLFWPGGLQVLLHSVLLPMYLCMLIQYEKEKETDCLCTVLCTLELLIAVGPVIDEGGRLFHRN